MKTEFLPGKNLEASESDLPLTVLWRKLEPMVANICAVILTL